MSKPKLGMSKAEFYKVMAIALALSLVISWAGFYAYYVSVQPSEQPFRPFQVQGILSVYKNGILVHQGPDVLTNAFYDYLPFLLGNVCAMNTNNAPDICPSGSWADNLFTAPPQPPSCSIRNGGFGPKRVPITFSVSSAPSALYIQLGRSASASPSDCVLSAAAVAQASVAVFSPYLGNENNPPAPCPNPTQGCVQITANFGGWQSPDTFSDAQLLAAYGFATLDTEPSTLFTLIAHDVFQFVSVNPGDTLTIVYTFIFPGVQTNAGAYSQPQGAIAALFAQCLSRKDFGIGTTGNKICLDPVKLDNAQITAYIPLSPCSDSQLSTSYVENVNNKITIETSAASKFVKIYAPMSAAGSGIQFVRYTILTPGGGWIIILGASQTCSVATQQPFQQGQAVGLQLTWP